MKTIIRTVIITLFFICLAHSSFSQIMETPSNPYEVEYEEKIINKDFRFAVGGGYSYRLGNIEKTNDIAIDNLSKKLRNGYNLNADAQYFFKEKWGVGIEANMSAFSTSGGNFTLDGKNITTYDETQRIIYVGPSFATRLESEKFIMLASIGFGPLFFVDNITANGVNGIGNKTTLGSNLTLSAEYKMQNKMGVGLKISQTAGNIDSMTFEGQTIQSNEAFNLSSFSISLFLSFRSW